MDIVIDNDSSPLKCARKDTLDILDFDSNLDNDKKKASKRFWTYVKLKKKDSCSIPSLRSKGVLIADAVGKANILNRQYSSVFTLEDTNNIPSKGPSKAPPMPNIKISVRRCQADVAGTQTPESTRT